MLHVNSSMARWRCGAAAAAATVVAVRMRDLLLGVALVALGACATASAPAKARELTPAEGASVSQALEPLLTAAGLWRASDGCAAVYGLLDADPVGVALTPHAPCRVKVVLTEGALARTDRESLRALLAHELAHLELGHPEARQARVEAQKQTQEGVKAVSRAGSKAVSLIPGVGGWISKGIGTARKAATAAMEMHGNPYLPEEEQAADAMAVTLLNQTEASSCRALRSLLEERLRAPGENAWSLWIHVHPVSAERIDALAAPCPGTGVG
jgi:Zn-dependent protease with chaperone function